MASPSPEDVVELLCISRQEGANLLPILGSAVDGATALGDARGLLETINRIREVITDRQVAGENEARLRYFEGNAWGAIRQLRHQDPELAWAWESDEHESELLALRRAVNHPSFYDLTARERCQILTNLASLMSTVGRMVEAIAYYDRALQIDSSFGMALGNRAQCILRYAQEHYEPSHRCIMAGHAASGLESALQTQLEYPEVRLGFRERLQEARSMECGANCADPEHLHSHSLGRSEAEQAFRSWALRERLFLNPLNDLGPYAVAGWDYLLLPPITVPAEFGTGFHGFYNQLKQEFAAARWLLFEATAASDPAFVDQELNIVDTLDGATFGIAVEKLKMSLRLGYSTFDKVAKFLSYYFAIEDRIAYFRYFWYEKRKKNAQTPNLRPVFANRQNLALRALFWLSKDLATQEGDRHEALDPDAQGLADLRNALEHGYVKVQTPLALGNQDPPPDPFPTWTSEDELRAKALRVLGMLRAALIYLPLAVHAEERGRPHLEGVVQHGHLDPR